MLIAPHFFTEQGSLGHIAAARQAYEEGSLRDRLERHHGANTDDVFNGWATAWLDPDFSAWNIEEYLPAISVPVLVVQGADDPYGTPVETHLLPECRHAPHLEKPAETDTAVSGFINRLLDA